MVDASNTCDVVVGRLLEIRLGAGYKSVADVDAMIGMISAAITNKVPANEQVIIVADWRTQRVMDPATAARANVMLTRNNPRVLRSAILTVPEQPTTNLQVVRLVREAQNPERHHFVEPSPLRRWLDDVLRTEERARLSTFLP